ncbi:MAG: DNA polymerase III subunit gamma/tau [Burkholderiaceae bacterium]|nr:DNA polymerase III subunit gamma/tau [Burkholderiaceae bacterium]
MPHVVLARKYRPRSFEQMVGQSHVVQALTNALESGRLHHAYLFTGTRGIGKTTVSRILAKSLNCTGADGTGGVTAHPCGVCQACTEIDADRFIDYIELDAASNRSIDEIRELIERAAYKPSVGRYKVFMIDEAHQLTKDAFNALLKTLEEPPEYLKFVLATTDPEKMLPTVLSRCLQFNLRPMAPETVLEHLQSVLQAEAVAAEDGALRLLARAARGSMRDALSLTDQAIAYGAGTLAEAGVRAMLGSVDRSHAAQLVQALAQRDGPALLAGIATLRERGLSAAGTLEEMATLLQQMAVEQAVPGALDEADPDSAGARQLAGELAADETQLLYGIALHGRAELGLLSDEYAALTMVLLRFLAFPPAGAPAPAPARAAPLVAPAAVARASAPVRPVVKPVAVAAPAPARGPVPAPAQASTPAPARPAASPSPGPSSSEPPPWLDEAPPLDDAAWASAPAMAPSAVSEPEPPVFDEPRPSRREPAAAAPLATTPVSPSAPPLQPTALGEQWSELLRPLIAQGAVAALVRELALQAELLDVQATPAGRRYTLRVERETLRAPAHATKLAGALQAALGEPVQVEVQAGQPQDSIARREAAAREAAQREAERAIRDDATVQALLAQFPGARIVPGSIKPLGA